MGIDVFQKFNLMTEAFLQYIWQHRLLEGPLTTVDGLPVVVERPGEHNLDAGPDFFDARMTVDGIRWAGNVEVHINASDWHLHHHNDDPNYHNVILHVVYCYDADIRLPDGRILPTMELRRHIPQGVWDRYDQLMHPADGETIACASRIADIPDFLIHAANERLAAERLERKVGEAQHLLDETRGDWDEACYRLMARSFGGKVNALPFELLAKTTPLSLLAKIKHRPLSVEALFFGQSGLLEDEFADDYPSSLQREYAYLRASYRLQPMPGHLWKFFRLYPASFPTLRISQFANLLLHTDNLFSKMLDGANVDTLRQLFCCETDPYWMNHYLFDQLAPSRPKRLGRSVVDRILINAWVPLLFAYGKLHDSDQHKEQALSLLQQLPAERNRIVDRWTDLGLQPDNAAQSQSLIQRYNEYCQRHRCLDCNLAFRLLKTEGGSGQGRLSGRKPPSP